VCAHIAKRERGRDPFVDRKPLFVYKYAEGLPKKGSNRVVLLSKMAGDSSSPPFNHRFLSVSDCYDQVEEDWL